MNENQKLLKQIQICDFVLFETALYLDTHKTDKEALAFYQKHKKENQALREEYTQKFGPLSISDSSNEKVWEWVDSSWPWEYCHNEGGRK